MSLPLAPSGCFSSERLCPEMMQAQLGFQPGTCRPSFTALPERGQAGICLFLDLLAAAPAVATFQSAVTHVYSILDGVEALQEASGSCLKLLITPCCAVDTVADPVTPHISFFRSSIPALSFVLVFFLSLPFITLC